MIKEKLKQIVLPNTKGFLIRIALFCVLYALIFYLHPIISLKILGYSVSSAQHYFVYLLYPILFLFTLTKWDQIKEIKPYKNEFWHTLFFSLLAIIIFLLPLKQLVADEVIPFQFIYYYPMYLGYASLFIAIFNWNFVKKFTSELSTILFIILFYMAFQVLLQSLWPYFSHVILSAQGLILPLFSDSVEIIPSELYVKMEDFWVTIGATCSGIFSITTFTFLFIATILMIQKNSKIHMPKTIIALIAGLLATYLLNIIRVSIIIIIGAFYSADLALELFHEYLSAIFLIVLFVGYLYFVFPRLIVKPKQITSENSV